MCCDRVCPAMLVCLIGIGWPALTDAASRVVYEEDFSDQPVGSTITSPPASWTKGNPGDQHMGELIITDITKLGPLAVDGSASTKWYGPSLQADSEPGHPGNLYPDLHSVCTDRSGWLRHRLR